MENAHIQYACNSFLFLFLLCIYVYWHIHTSAASTEEGTRSSRIRVIGEYESLNIGTGNQKWLFWKSSQYSQALSHLSVPDVMLNKSDTGTAYYI